MNILKYYIRDAREGFRRNGGAAFTTVLLIFLSLSLTSSLVIVRTSMDDIIHYLNSQVNIKVFVDSSLDVASVAQILNKNPLIKQIQIENKQETLQNLKRFFENKAYLMDAFTDSDFPDSIVIELKAQADSAYVAEQLRSTKGITDVFYPQKFAQTILTWENKINLYGTMMLLVFLIASFLTITMTINLALYQRQHEVRVKLLLGAKPFHVRGQFLFESGLMGLLGGILASLVVYGFYQYTLVKLQMEFSFIFNSNVIYVLFTLFATIIFGLLIGLFGGFFSTRRLVKHV